VCFGTEISFLWYAFIGSVSTMAVGYIASRFDRPPTALQLDGLTWARRPPRPE
jgi:hypothetical protein